jgi:hypothetical protein
MIGILRACRLLLALPPIVLLTLQPASGQYVRVIQTCSRDFTKFCTATTPDKRQFADCIETHFQEFSEPCQAAVIRTGAVREACAADIRAQCSAVKPGAGRILLCVKGHFAALSDQCKRAIGQAAERKAQAH